MAQTTWMDCTFDSLWYSGDVHTDRPCRVRIGDGHIEVTYEEEDGLVSYSGTELAPGHFRLKSTQADGETTLHMFPGARAMCGYFTEGGGHGMWRIKLA